MFRGLYASPLSVVSGFRYIYQLPRLCLQSLWVIYLIVTIPLGISLVVSDQLYLYGWKNNDLPKLKLASSLFPYNREIVVGPAFKSILDGIPTEESFKDIRIGLKTDPYSIEMLLANMRTSAIIGDNEEALKSYYTLKRVAPLVVKNVRLLNANSK